MNVKKAARKKLMRARRSALNICRKTPALHGIIQLDMNRRKRNYLRRVKTLELKENSIFFESFSGARYGCSPRAIYQELCADPRFDDWTFYWSFRPGKRPLITESLELGRAVIVTPNTSRYFNALATCKYWIRNNRVAEQVVPRTEQVYIQTWHGTPLKALGLDAKQEIEGGSFNSGKELARQNVVDAQKWTYLISPSPYTSEHLSSAFGVSEERAREILIEEGYPRNDAIVNGSRNTHFKESIHSRLQLPSDKKILLYAPTWRDDQRDEEGRYYFNLPFDLDLMREKLSDEWIVLIRLHTLVSSQLDLSSWQNFALNVSDVSDINDLYCIADALCTDYSSVFFDFANTDRPMYFYIPDYEHYREALHDFYIDIEEIPGPKCTTTEELIAALKDNDRWMMHFGQDYADFKQRFCPWDDGLVSKRVIERCIEA